ncbi:HAD family phosphatase [Sporichthya sp.]|uniref:HAD family hydrolase n=1 Tax=Sporichthya sp. TaxID=65475 RepID=UPI00185C3023|nr:HAD family phosphatase [Sporichthya sp.]MBA3744041.1 HAD family phosphatase [Sporichthya sp.]
MTEPQIRSVVFDVGGVLVVSPLGEFAKVDTEYGLAEGTAMGLFRGGSEFVECETGRTSFAEFSAGAVAGVEAEQGIAVPPERLGVMMTAIMGGAVHAPMYELVLELKAAGLQIGILSNVYRELDGWLRAAFPPGTVDVFAPSYDLGLRKPEPAIYARLIEMCGLPPEQIVFVDDFEENVAGAGAAGLHAILFNGEDALRKELRELGVDV